MNDKELYSIVGIGTLLTTVTLPTISILPLSIGAIGVGSLYGCYRILTRHERRIKEERKEFEEFFMGAGLMNKQNEIPILANIYENDYETIYSFIKPSGFSTVNFESRDVAIQEYFGREMIEFESKGDFINIKVTTADLPNFIPFQMKERKNKDEIIVSLGRDIKGNDVELNLSKCPNVMCSGCTGSGKSVNTNVIATQLYCNYPNVQMYLIDMKCVELGIYADLPQTKEYTNKLEGAKKIIKELLEECDRRNELFNKLKVKKLSDYNKKVNVKDRLNPIVLIIDEAVRLMGDKDLNKDIAELGFICRSVEISIILNIQRPTAKLLNPDIKASLTNIIGFRTINKRNSEVICDSNVLARLKGKGNGMLFNEDNDGIEFQGYYLGESEIEKYLNKYCNQ
jgi:S-DNA-T family DNA segregation ATPase FtsK/SpoIIIE